MSGSHLSSSRIPRWLVTAITLAAATGAALAGTISLEWDAVDHEQLTGYRVYYGTSSGSYDTTRDVGSTSTTLTGLQDCTTYYVAVKARGSGPDESPDYSNEISGWARPELDAVTPDMVPRGTQTELVLSGRNFQTGVIVELDDPSIAVDSVTRNGCGELRVQVTVGAATSLGDVAVSVVNPDDVFGQASSLLSIAPELDTTPPAISALGAGSVTASGATVTWTTDEPSDSQVFYRRQGTSSYQSTSRASALVTSHSVTLAGLDPDTTYEFYVRSADAEGNEATLDGAPFTTELEPDTTPPSISTVGVGDVTQSGATVTWTTDEPSDSQVFYRRQGTSSYQSTSRASALVTSHSVTLSGLAADTTYEFYVRSADADDNEATLDGAPFTTELEPDNTGPVISGAAVGGVTAFEASVSWTTDEPADSQVLYRRAGTSTYQETRLDTTRTTAHQVRLAGLRAGTQYETRIRSTDAAGNESLLDGPGFTTSPPGATVIRIEAESGPLTAPAEIGSGDDAFGGKWIRVTADATSGEWDYGFWAPAGEWTFWFRMYGPTRQSDGWIESVDGSSPHVVRPSNVGEWEWVRGRSFDLTEGLHTLRLRMQEPLAQLDQVLLADDPDFVPGDAPGTDVTAPNVVGGVTASTASRVVTLGWRAPADEDVDSIVVRFRTDGSYPQHPADGMPLEVQPASAGATGSYVHGGLDNGTTVYYGLFALDEEGNASAAATISATPTPTPQPLGSVRNLRRSDKRSEE